MGLRWLFSFFFLLFFSFSINGLDTSFPIVIEQYLEESGYYEGDYKIQLLWVEHTKKGSIYGVLLEDIKTGLYEEIYFDEKGNKLEIGDLKYFNINPKNWFSNVVNVPNSTGEIQQKSYKKDVESEKVLIKNLLLKPSQYTFNLPLPFLEDVISGQPEKGGLEIGTVVSLDEPLLLFKDTSPILFSREKIDSYYVYSLNFFIEGALGIKLHLAFPEMLPPLHNLYIKANDYKGEIVSVSVKNEDVWSPLILSSEVTLYYVLPESASIKSVPIIVSEYAYIYTNPVDELTKLGTCYKDVMCYDPWRTLSKGVVGIVKVASPNVIFCTGSLLNDGRDEQISRFVLTAFHCVDTQYIAENLDFLWLYQSIDCNGIVPDITTVSKTTGGADFLVGSPTSEGTDMTLLRMKNYPPNSVIELGFTNALSPIGTDVVAIHHPGRSYKRISFGKTTDTGSPLGRGVNLRPLDRYHEVIYNLSSTESGSSGGPLFRADTQQIIGQLWGGNASCVYMNEPDYFGRFDISYPLLEPYIFIPPNIFDVDGSGIVDYEDISFVVKAVLGAKTRIKSDLNNDGATDASDIRIIENQVQ